MKNKPEAIYYWPELDIICERVVHGQGDYIYVNHDPDVYACCSYVFFFKSISKELIFVGEL